MQWISQGVLRVALSRDRESSDEIVLASIAKMAAMITYRRGLMPTCWTFVRGDWFHFVCGGGRAV